MCTGGRGKSCPLFSLRHMSRSCVHRLRGSFPPMHLHSVPAYPAEGSKQLSQNSAHQTPSTQPPGCCLAFPSTRMESSNTPTLGGGTISFILIQTLKEIKLFAIELRFRKKIICNPSKLPCVHSIHHHCTEGQEQRVLSRKPEFTRP